MPEGWVHRLVSKLLLGDEFKVVHLLKDLPSVIFGEKHRRFYHDKYFTLYILLRFGKKAALASLLHDLLDRNPRLAKLLLLLALCKK